MPAIDHDQELGRHVPGIQDAVEVEVEDDLDDDTQIIENDDGSVTFVEPSAEEMESTGFSQNLAELLPKSKLDSLAIELIEKVERDRDARKKRDEQYADGLKRSGLSGDAPGGADFSGASKAVHPVLAEASVDFESAAIKELYPPDGPVKAKLRGKETDAKKKRASRKVNFLNWQLTKEIEEYPDELEQTLSQLPMGGSQYQKWRYDETLGRPIVEFVPVDEVFLPYAAVNFYTAQRVTHRQQITRAEFEDRVRSGLYKYDLDASTDKDSREDAFPEQTQAQQANDKIEGREEDCYNDDGLRTVYEIYTWEMFDDPECDAERPVPYIITVDERTQETVAIYRNWAPNDKRYRKLDWWVEYGFIPWRGAYKLGLPHLIGGLAVALTGSLRALLDSAHINNAPTMLKLKSGRISGQTTSIDVTQVQEIEGPAGIQDIRQLAMPMPFNPPSAVLFQLLGWLTDAAKGVVTTAEEKIADVTNQMPVGTTLALIEQGSKVASAIHARLHRSQAKSMEILCRINATWFDEERAREVFGEEAPTREDFLNNEDIQPVSDPAVFSEAQRFAKWQALVQMAQDQTVPWNKLEVYREGLRLMKIDDTDRYLPPPQEPEELDPTEENIGATINKPLKVYPTQDDLMHIASHLKFATSPLIQVAGLVLPTVPALVAHVKEHLMQYYREHAAIAAQTAEALQQARGAEAQTRTSDLVMETMLEELKPILQLFMQAQQLAAKAQQQATPPLDPQSQVSLQLGMAEIERKKAVDQASLQLKQQEAQGRAQGDQARLQLDAQREQFDQQIERLSLMMKARADEMAEQTKLLQNQQDNHQHQVTELLKNREDNQTNVIVAEIRNQLDAQGQALEFLKSLAQPLEGTANEERSST